MLQKTSRTRRRSYSDPPTQDLCSTSSDQGGYYYYCCSPSSPNSTAQCSGSNQLRDALARMKPGHDITIISPKIALSGGTKYPSPGTCNLARACVSYYSILTPSALQHAMGEVKVEQRMSMQRKGSVSVEKDGGRGMGRDGIVSCIVPSISVSRSSSLLLPNIVS